MIGFCMVIRKRTWGQIRKLPRGTYLASKGTEEKVKTGYWIPHTSKTKTQEFKTLKAALRFIGKPKKRY